MVIGTIFIKQVGENMVKQDDMLKVIIKEIVELQQELTFSAEDSMRKMQRIQTRLSNNNTNNEHQMEFVKENDKKIKRIKKRLDIFPKIFEIILDNLV